jgi:cytidylate kinase
MVEQQRALTRDHCMVMVGRDIGTVVLPQAPVKLWVTASPEERARRRLAERLPGAEHIEYSDAVRMISERDALDSGRAVSPLKRAADSIDIDTEHVTPNQALAVACDAVRLAVSRARAGS